MDNLDVRWRLVDLNGPLGEIQEVDLPGNALNAAVAATASGWLLAASGAGEQVFEAFTLPLDPDGNPTGPLADLDADPGGGEFWVDVAEDAAARTWVAWEVDDEVAVAVDGEVERIAEGGSPSIAASEAGPVWVGWGDGAGDLWTRRDDGDPVRLRGGADFQHSLALATAQDGEGGLAAWMVNISGLSNRVVVARFDGQGEVLEQQDLGTVDAAPYGLRLARLSDEVAFVGWAEGTSPAFRAAGSFVRFDAF